MSRLPAASAPSCILVMLLLAGCARGVAAPELEPGAGAPAAMSVGDEEAAARTRMAVTALSTGEAATAASLFEEALAQDGRNLAAAIGLGNALLSLSRPQEAGRAFERALAIDEGAMAARYGYARAMLALRRPELARGQLEAILARRPNDVRALNALGVANDLVGRQDLALAAYRRGLAVAPGDLPLRNNLGLSLALAGHFEQALDQLGPLGEGPEASRRTRQNLALVYGPAGDLSAARRVGRADLSEHELEANLAYVASVRGLADPSLRASAMAPLPPGPAERGAMPEAAPAAMAVEMASLSDQVGPVPGHRITAGSVAGNLGAAQVVAPATVSRQQRTPALPLTPFFD